MIKIQLGTTRFIWFTCHDHSSSLREGRSRVQWEKCFVPTWQKWTITYNLKLTFCEREFQTVRKWATNWGKCLQMICLITKNYYVKYRKNSYKKIKNESQWSIKLMINLSANYFCCDKMPDISNLKQWEIYFCLVFLKFQSIDHNFIDLGAVMKLDITATKTLREESCSLSW